MRSETNKRCANTSCGHPLKARAKQRLCNKCLAADIPDRQPRPGTRSAQVTCTNSMAAGIHTIDVTLSREPWILQ